MIPLIKTSRDAILKPLANCVGIVERKHTLPILSNVLLKKEGDALYFLATDTEIQSTTHTFAQSGDACTTTVAARKLLDIVKALPEGNEVSLNYEGKKVTVQSGKSRFSIQTLEADDFPTMTVPTEWTTEFSISQKTLKQLLSQVSFSMAQQDIRYYLNGLLLNLHQNTLKAVATDGHRLAYAQTTVDTMFNEDLKMIIPRKTILEMLRQLDESDAIVQIKATDEMIQFEFLGHTILSKLIDGTFPDFNRVLPKNHNKLVEINRSVLHAALSRSAIMTTDKFKGVKLALTTNNLTINSSNSDQEEAVDELDVVYNDEDITIGFNVTYLLDVLSNLKVENIQFHFDNGNASAMLTVPTPSVANDMGFKYVVMPMRI